MKILFDHSTPRQLRPYLTPPHNVILAKERGWAEYRNGDLPRVAEPEGFDIVVTTDQNWQHQQQLTGRRLAIVVLLTNHRPTLMSQADKVLAAVNVIRPGEYVEVSFTMLPRRRRNRQRSTS